MTSKVWIDSSHRDYAAHTKAIIALPGDFDITENSQEADYLVCDSANAQAISENAQIVDVDLFFFGIKRIVGEIPDALLRTNEKLVTLKISEVNQRSVESCRLLLQEALRILGIAHSIELAQSESPFSIGFSGGADGLVLSALFVETLPQNQGIYLRVSDKDQRFEMNIPILDYADPLTISTHTLSGTSILRPVFESVAKSFWLSLAVA